VKGWTVEATFRADKPDGVILARGGVTAGYSLLLKDGKPTWVVVSNQQSTVLTAKDALSEGWHTVTATITADQRLTLVVDGKPAGERKLHDFIRRDPNDTMQIGQDRGSPVTPEPKPFVGRIESIRIFSGERP
jgi:Concanavalin A-like lectin/glucanases superfamily